LNKAHLIVAYLQQENRELKKNVSQEISHPSEGEPSRRALAHAIKYKTKQIIDVEYVQVTVKQSRRPRNRSIAKIEMEMKETIQPGKKVFFHE